jgi:diketogulonate reductase-like aldo/keto reductase
LHRGPGLGLGQHALAGVIALVAAGAAIVAFPRLRPGLQSALAFSFGVVDELVALAAETGRTPARLALAWTLARPEISSVVLGARTPGQLDEQLATLDVVLAPDELARLDAVSPPGRAIVPYYLDDDFADWRAHRHRW